MVKKSDSVAFVPNKYFYMSAFFALVTVLFVCYGLRNDDVVYLLESIFLGIIGLFFINKSKKFKVSKKKKR